MKNKLWVLLLVSLLGFHQASEAQSYELARLMLDIEKLSQLKSILSDLYKGYAILKTGYTSIKGIAEGNYNLHKAFLDGLLEVSPAIQSYEKISDIVDLQAKIFSTCKSSLSRYRKSPRLNPDELEYIAEVYGHLGDKTARCLEKLIQVLSPGKLRMNDAERLRAIEGIDLDTRDQWSFLSRFRNRTDILEMSRTAQDQDVQTLRDLRGIQ